MKFTLRTISLIILFIFISINAFSKIQFEIKEGDLLFQDIDCGELCDAIEEVTIGYKGARISHIGMAVKDSLDDLKIIEAVGKGVVLTDIEEFLSKSLDSNNQPKVFVGRLKAEYAQLIPNVCVLSKKYLGKAYDNYFIIENDELYCSELIYFAFKSANNEQDFFELKPMTFKSPKSLNFFEPWLKYYQNLKFDIPEGKLGINPGGISLSNKIDVYFPFGKPDGIQE